MTAENNQLVYLVHLEMSKMAVTVYTEEHFAQTKVDVVEGQLFQIKNKKDKVSNDDSQEVEVVDGI